MADSLPTLIDFYEEYGNDDRFEILAFHDDSVNDLEDLDSRLVKIKEKYWKGRDLPFPILHDSSCETIKQFGIRAFPTMILVDPEGKLVGMTHGVYELKAKLGIED